MAGYHVNFIPKGKLGDFSKIEEELFEFKDAHQQNSSIMELIELSDLIGASIAYYRKNGQDSRWLNIHDILIKEKSNTKIDFEDLISMFDSFNKNNINLTDFANFILAIHHYVKNFNMTYKDLYKMHKITERAFLNGQRK
jgi:hypothetical protein